MPDEGGREKKSFAFLLLVRRSANMQTISIHIFCRIHAVTFGNSKQCLESHNILKHFARQLRASTLNEVEEWEKQGDREAETKRTYIRRMFGRRKCRKCLTTKQPLQLRGTRGKFFDEAE